MAVEYIDNQWMQYKEKFVRCYTNRYLHLGTTSSSRGESSHYALKRNLTSSKLDFLSFYKQLKLMLTNQFAELEKKTEAAEINLYGRHGGELLSNLIHKVSPHALDLVLNQVKLLDKDSEECSGSFHRIYGLPCRHQIKSMVAAGKLIQLTDIHSQWRLHEGYVNSSSTRNVSAATEVTRTPKQKAIAMVSEIIERLDDVEIPSYTSQLERLQTVSLQNPQPVSRKRGRPTISSHKPSNKRDRSAFEYVTGSKCGKCGEGGHNARTCSRKEKCSNCGKGGHDRRTCNTSSVTMNAVENIFNEA